MKTFLLAAGVMLMCSCSPRHELVIGTYGEHLYRCSFDGDNFTILGSAEAVNPSYALACDGGIFAAAKPVTVPGYIHLAMIHSATQQNGIRQEPILVS